jgi:hypothetical protein
MMGRLGNPAVLPAPHALIYRNKYINVMLI